MLVFLASEIAPINVIDDGDDNDDSGKGRDPCHDGGEKRIGESHVASQPYANF